MSVVNDAFRRLQLRSGCPSNGDFGIDRGTGAFLSLTESHRELRQLEAGRHQHNLLRVTRSKSETREDGPVLPVLVLGMGSIVRMFPKTQMLAQLSSIPRSLLRRSSTSPERTERTA